MDKDLKDIKKELIETNKRLNRITSIKYNFFLSIIKGVGSILGATIVFAILIGILSRIIRGLGGIPMLERILEVGIGSGA